MVRENFIKQSRRRRLTQPQIKIMKKFKIITIAFLALAFLFQGIPAHAGLRDWYSCGAQGHVNFITDATLQTIALQCQVQAGLIGYATETFATMGTASYPGALDSATIGSCSTSNPCLTEMNMRQPLLDPHWSKVSDTQYDRSTGESCIWDGAGGFTCS